MSKELESGTDGVKLYVLYRNFSGFVVIYSFTSGIFFLGDTIKMYKRRDL